MTSKQCPSKNVDGSPCGNRIDPSLPSCGRHPQHTQDEGRSDLVETELDRIAADAENLIESRDRRTECRITPLKDGTYRIQFATQVEPCCPTQEGPAPFYYVEPDGTIQGVTGQCPGCGQYGGGWENTRVFDPTDQEKWEAEIVEMDAEVVATMNRRTKELEGSLIADANTAAEALRFVDLDDDAAIAEALDNAGLRYQPSLDEPGVFIEDGTLHVWDNEPGSISGGFVDVTRNLGS